MILSFASKCILDCNEGRCKKSFASSGKHVTVIRNESQVTFAALTSQFWVSVIIISHTRSLQ